METQIHKKEWRASATVITFANIIDLVGCELCSPQTPSLWVQVEVEQKRKLRISDIAGK